MKNTKPLYHGHRFPPEIISHAVWLYHRFCLSFRDVEDLLPECGVEVSYESIRQWCSRFGPDYAHKLKKGRVRMGDSWFLDEIFVTIRGKLHYLWRAIDGAPHPDHARKTGVYPVARILYELPEE